MKKTFKKIIASIMAVTTLTVCTTGFSASAVEPRYGGTGTFYVNGVAVHKSIDGYKSSASATTRCDSESCSFVYVSVYGYYTDTQSKTDYGSKIRGTITKYFNAETGKKFIKVESYHSATVNHVNDTEDMVVNL